MQHKYLLIIIEYNGVKASTFSSSFYCHFLNLLLKQLMQKEKISLKKKGIFLEEITGTFIQNLDIIDNENIIKVWINIFHLH